LFSDLLGVKWLKGGRDLKGLDCYGLAMIAKKRLEGIDLPEYSTPDDDATFVNMILKEVDIAEKIEVPVSGCFVLFAVGGPYKLHIGVMVDNDKFIHILRNNTVSIERISHPFWKSKVKGLYKWNNRQ